MEWLKMPPYASLSAMKTITMSELARHIYNHIRDVPLFIKRSYKKGGKNMGKDKKKENLVLLPEEQYRNLEKVKELAEKANLIPKYPDITEMPMPNNQENMPKVDTKQSLPPPPPKPSPTEDKTAQLLEEFMKNKK